jgi:putative lipoprotein
VYYLQRIAVPPNAKLSVTLLDVTDLNRPRTLAEQSQAVSAVPVNYELRFNPASIHEGRIYQVKAELTMSEGKVWTHTKAYPVLTGNAPAYAEIVVGPQ